MYFVCCLLRPKKFWKKKLVEVRDETLISLSTFYGRNLLARAFPGRSGKQCRERWHNHVDDRVKKGEWTHEVNLTSDVQPLRRCRAYLK